MTNNNTFIGIDVSKKSLVVYNKANDKTKTFKNNALGFEKLMNFIGKPNNVSCIVLEPTGGYEEQVLDCLAINHYPVCRVNAQYTHAFALSKGCREKTDNIDAKILADYGEAMKPKVHIPLPDDMKKLKLFVLRRSQISNMIAQEKNRLEKSHDPILSELINKILKQLMEELKSLEKQIAQIIQNNHKMNAIASTLCSLKGVGIITAAILMTYLPELGKIDKKKVAKLAGLAPLDYQSGNMCARSKIGYGRPILRNSLFLVAMSAAYHNPQMHDFYIKLKAKHKAPKQALIAVAHKMLDILGARLAQLYAQS